MRIILLFLATFLFANERYLIAQFENLKPYYYNHQIVDLKLKIISAKDGNISVTDDKNNSYSIYKEGNSFISNISFELNNTFPSFFVSLQDNNVTLEKLNIQINSKIKNLYPPKNFCGVLADKLSISDTILTNYDDNNNIVYFTIQAKNANLKDFKLHQKDEKLYFLDKNDTISKYSYSAIVSIDKKLFNFTYFNLKDEKYENISFEVNVKNETISTQTDVKPMAKSNLYIINAVLGILIVLWIILYFYKRKIVYIVLILLTLASIVFFNLPKQEIILKEGTKVHILPFKGSTIFVVLAMDTKVKVLESKDGYKKIEFNKYIGWVKDE